MLGNCEFLRLAARHTGEHCGCYRMGYVCENARIELSMRNLVLIFELGR